MIEVTIKRFRKAQRYAPEKPGGCVLWFATCEVDRPGGLGKAKLIAEGRNREQARRRLKKQIAGMAALAEIMADLPNLSAQALAAREAPFVNGVALRRDAHRELV